METIINIGDTTRSVDAKLTGYKWDNTSGIGEVYGKYYYTSEGQEVIVSYFSNQITVNPVESAELQAMLSDAVAANPIP